MGHVFKFCKEVVWQTWSNVSGRRRKRRVAGRWWELAILRCEAADGKIGGTTAAESGWQQANLAEKCTEPDNHGFQRHEQTSAVAKG